MRADRLISVLLLLQRRGKVTVAEVAEELEISQRTARRDLEALMFAGVPVYSRPGRGGGWSLVGGATTDLSGLTEGEARSLFLSIGATNDKETAQALNKLGHALPGPFRDAAASLASRSLVDHDRWGRAVGPRSERPACFRTVADALAVNRVLEFDYERPGAERRRRRAEPLGLVHKAGRWYLMADTDDGRRNFRLDRMSEVTIADEPFEPPSDFDLTAAWDEALEGFAQVGRNVTTRVRLLDDRAVWAIRSVFGGRASEAGDDVFDVGSWSVHTLAHELLALGDRVEVIDPDEVRAELHAVAHRIAARHA